MVKPRLDSTTSSPERISRKMIKPSLDWQSIFTTCQCLCLSMQSVISSISSVCQCFVAGIFFFIPLFQNSSFNLPLNPILLLVLFLHILTLPMSSFSDSDKIGVRLALNVITEGLSPHSLIKVDSYNIYLSFSF